MYFVLQTKQSKVYVEVCSLTLHSDSSISQDPTVELLFVDYHGFLGLPPDQLETPHSLPKPPPGCVINFNFGQGNLYSIYTSLIGLFHFFRFSYLLIFEEEPDNKRNKRKHNPGEVLLYFRSIWASWGYQRLIGYCLITCCWKM